ncbi:oxysterol-binding protein-related protein 5-like isoform X2 [Scleropages formosus]|uniref:oxysterol-binding protein-related protein 5-like isoform X2 n=1 Tax=Scleropages formosus TaxID=113540 RepID=UPI0010FA9804|nr:oxysterol-binding protein-related protein 5-like isoform X2 [Scleropages formosus]
MMSEKSNTAAKMKEETLLRRRFSLCPSPSSGQKIDPRSLMRNLSYGGDNDVYPLCPGSEGDKNGVAVLRDEGSFTLSPSSKSELKAFEPHEKECSSPTEKLACKDSLKIRGTLKRWTKLWCVLKPGVLLIYKTPKMDQWVGTILLNACTLIERPSKKDGFCFKLYHPLDQSIWATKGPEGENVGSITQPLPSSYLISRAASESDGRCWMDALELALSCSSLCKLTPKASFDGDLGSCSESSQNIHLLQSSPSSDLELSQLNETTENSILENDGYSDKSERETHGDSDNGANDNDGRLTEESDMDQTDDLLPGLQSTAYVEQNQEEMAEAGEMSQVETVSEENRGLIWTLLKQLRPGMDLSKVVLPTFILEPRSFLDKLSDYYYHADFLSRAVLEESPYCRMKQVLRWYLSGFYKKPKGLKKPYNPILGETFRCCWLHPKTDSCTFYIAEQVSHHPPVSAFYVSNKKDGFCISGSILAKSKFYGNSLSAVLDGKARLVFLARDEEYVITMPYAHCKGILYGTMSMELGGKITIDCKTTNYLAELEFKLKPFLGSSSSVNQISGKIRSGEEVLANIDGHWDAEVILHEKKTGHQEVLWNPTTEVRQQRLKRQVVPLYQQGAFESERLWQHVTNAILNQDQVRATQEKFILEEAQRREARERGNKAWTPQLFTLDPTSKEWCYRYADRKPWDPDTSLIQFEKDGVIQMLERQPPGRSRLCYNQNWATQQKGQAQRKHRKSSSQPSSCSQNTESSSSTPEPTHESSDNEDFVTQCVRCNKELKDFAQIEAYIASIRKSQQEIQRNLCALSQQMRRDRDSEENLVLGGRCCMILCVLLLFQLFINYMNT